jgi:hypothetical protein
MTINKKENCMKKALAVSEAALLPAEPAEKETHPIHDQNRA